jgi:hypothetical protein
MEEAIMGQVTHDQANLLLRLYELRREPRLRQARAWFVANFEAKSPEEIMQKCPPGSEASTNMRMTIGYWEMAAGLANRGLIDDDLFFENAGEGFFVYDRIRELLPAMRAAYKNPHAWAQLEAFGKRMEAWVERRAPGHVAHMRQMIASMRPAAAKSAND